MQEQICCLHTGIRQFHFNAWKDPNGTLARSPAGLKLAGITNVTLDPKYTYFGAEAYGISVLLLYQVLNIV